MALRDVLFGRKKLTEPSDDRLFAFTTAAVTLQTELGLITAGAAAVAFKPLSSGEFAARSTTSTSCIDAAAQQCGSQIERKTDDFGFDWMVVHDPDLEDLVTPRTRWRPELTAQGFGAQLLAAAFPFEGGEHPVYWIYGFKRGAFWPFVPIGEARSATTRPSSN